MASQHSSDENAWRDFPLPLAQLCRRAVNAKTAIDAHLTAFSLAEAGLKLLSMTAVVHYAELPEHDPALIECLRKLARPSLGHWWEFARRLTPVLAETNDEYALIKKLLLDQTHEDCPRAAGLDEAMRRELGRKRRSGISVRFNRLFDHLIEYRNKVLYHAAPGGLPPELHEEMSSALLLGMTEVFSKLDVLAGNRLMYVSEVRPRKGNWVVSRFDLSGENPRRQPVLEISRTAGGVVFDEERVYLFDEDDVPRPLHPFTVFDLENEEFLMLNARRGSGRTEYLCYTSGRTEELAELGAEPRELLADVLKLEVTQQQVDDWAAEAEEEDDSFDPEESSFGQRMLGEFELITELGRGGMGVVYRARQPSLGREVALKKLLKTGSGSEQRFLREIRALGRVEHPHLVKILTSGSVGDDWYYAMELVDGVPLSAVCNKLQQRKSVVGDLDLETWENALTTACSEVRKSEKSVGDSTASDTHRVVAASVAEIPQKLRTGKGYVERIVELVRQAAGAADSLHEAGILHRDVKPGNIMVTADGRRALLMDLGLAQLSDEEDGRLTKTRQFVGTLRYASPEQVLAAEKVDRRSDIYGLGATLWELLTLQPLFAADETVPEAEVMRRIQLDEPEAVRRHNPRVDRDLDAIIGKCLEKRADRRYATARELAEDLRRWQRNEPVLARRVTNLEKSMRWFARRPALAAACLLTVLTLIFGASGGLALWQWREAESARHFADQARVAAETVRDELKISVENERVARDTAEAALAQARESEAKARAAQTELGRQNEELRATRIDLAQVGYADHMMLAQHEWDRGNGLSAQELLNNCDPEYRGFEWALFHSKFFEFESGVIPRSGGDSWGAIRPDGQRAATTDSEKRLSLIDVAGGESIRDGEFQVDGGRFVIFSPDGSRLAAVDVDGVAHIWNADSGDAVRELPAVEAAIFDLKFGPAGRQFAVATDDGLIRLFRPDAGSNAISLTGHEDAVNAVDFSPEGDQLASAGYDGTIRIWTTSTGVLEKTLADPSGESISHVVFSPDGRWVATSGFNGPVRLWDVQSGDQLATFSFSAPEQEYSFRFIDLVEFSPDGAFLATMASKDVSLWRIPYYLRRGGPRQRSGVSSDVPDYSQDVNLAGHTDWVYAMAFSPHGVRMATGGDGRIIRLWETSTGTLLATLTGHQAAVTKLRFSADGQRLTSLDSGGAVRTWDVVFSPQRRRSQVAFLGHTDRINSVRFSPDGRHAITAGNDQSVRIWEAGSGAEVDTILVTAPGADDYSYEYVQQALLSPDGRILGLATDEGRVELRDPADAAKVVALQEPIKKSSDFNLSGMQKTIAFSAEKMRLAMASSDATIKLWDAGGSPEPRIFTGHSGQINSLTFGPHGTRLASASSDGSVRLWDCESGGSAGILPRAPAAVNAVAFSPDGKQIATGGQDGEVRVYSAAGKEELWSGDEHGESIGVDQLGIISVVFDPAGKRVASAGDDGRILIWNAQSGELLVKLENGHTDMVRDIAFSPDGERLASASGDRTAVLWNVADGSQIAVLRDHTDWVNMVAFNPEGNYLATAGDDNSVNVWDGRTGELLHSLDDHADWVRAVAFSRDGRFLASGCDDRTVRVWETGAWQQVSALVGHTGIVRFVDFGSEGGQVLSATMGYQATSRLWDRESGEQLAEFSADFQGTDSSTTVTAQLAFSPDGARVASLALDKRTIYVWSTETNERLFELRGHPRVVQCLTYSPDGRYIASAGLDGVVRLWDMETGTAAAALEGHEPLEKEFGNGGVGHLAFSADGSLLASAGGDEVVRVWDVGKKALRNEFRGHDGSVQQVAISGDRKWVASASNDETVRLWPLGATGEQSVLKGHSDWVRTIAFSPDDTRLASSGDDGTVRIWGVNSGRAIAVFQQFPETDSIAPVFAFHPDGKSLAMTSSGHAVQYLSPDETDEQRLARTMEWHRWSIEAGERAGNPHAMLFHLEPLFDGEHVESKTYYQRATALALLRRFDEAVVDLQAARSLAETPADVATVSLRLGLAELERDNIAAYREICSEMLETEVRTFNTSEAIYNNHILVAWLATVRPDAVPRPDYLVTLAKSAVDFAPDDLFYQEVYAATLYRAGEYLEAARTLDELQKKSETGLNIESQLLFALACSRAGFEQDAMRFYLEARRLMGEGDPKGDDDETAPPAPGSEPDPPEPDDAEADFIPNPLVSWELRARRRHLLAEADALIADEIAPGAPPR